MRGTKKIKSDHLEGQQSNRVSSMESEETIAAESTTTTEIPMETAQADTVQEKETAQIDTVQEKRSELPKFKEKAQSFKEALTNAGESRRG